MSVPVRGTLRAPKTNREAESLFAQIGERLIALEKAVRGGTGQEILSPEVAPFGPGSGTNVTNVTNVVEGETDHGELLGLADDDHPQYVQRGERMHPLPHMHGTGRAVDLTDQSSSEGTSTLLARSDHLHQKLVQAEADGESLGDVSAVNIISPGLDVFYEPNLTGSLLTDLYGYWPLDEPSGARRCAIGTAPTLTESGGTITSAEGRFGDAITGDESDTFDLRATGASIPMSGGMTLAFWFYWPTWSSSYPKSMLSLDEAGTGFFQIARYYDSNYIEVGYYWSATPGDNVFLPSPRLGPFAVDTWHLLVIDYDAATGVLRGRVDEGCRRSIPFTDFGDVTIAHPANNLSVTVPGASLAAANAVTFTIVSLLKAFNANFKNFEGRIDALMLWNRKLTNAEVARLWVNRRATVAVNYLAMRVFGG